MNGHTAAEIYQVQPYYKRFNQKNNIISQRHWNEDAQRWDKEMENDLAKLLAKQCSGYQLEDLAFAQGANGNLVNTNFRINESFKQGNYWLPLSSRPFTQRAFPDFPYRATVKRHADPQSNSKLMTKMAKFFSADQIGFCDLDRRWVFSHYWNVDAKREFPIKFSDERGYRRIKVPSRLRDGTLVIPEEMKYCIVIIHEMDRSGIATAPTLTQLATTQLAYSRISYTAVMIAEFIRGLGFHAIPSANDLALSIPLAIDAGMGELGRSLKLIHPEYGPCCRISKVITDLPLSTGKPNLLGVAEFCKQCHKCAKSCPVGAISYDDLSLEPINECDNRGVLQWQLDHKKCAQYWAKVGTNCGICIRVCPFNKPNQGIHRLVRWAIKHAQWINPVFLWMDDTLRYGKYLEPSRFWDKE